jgi:hypothetical protein
MDKSPTLWGVIAALIGAALQALGVAGPVVGTVLMCLAIGFLIYAIRDPILDWWSDTVPLKKAARRFYEEACRSRSYWSSAADKLAVQNTAAARLQYCSHALKHADIKWFGVHPPSTIVEELPPSVVNSCSFLTDDLQILGTDQRTYTNIRVSKKGLNALLEKVRQGAGDI